MIGETISHYRIIEKIGEGGMGVVYEAEDLMLHRPVALKVLPPEAVADGARRDRFVQEARAASAINHPHIAQVYELGEHEGRHFIAMELIQGRTLRQLARDKKLSFDRLLEVMIQVTDALAKAHRQGIVHRDLKPENVMINEDGQAKVLDFGLAKLFEGTLASSVAAKDLSGMTRPGVLVGSPYYMSPEQAQGKPADRRSDTFSVGVMMYELATGARPFQGESLPEVMQAIISREPQPLSEIDEALPLEFQRMVQKSMAKRREGRYQDIKDLCVDLRQLQRELESGSAPRISDVRHREGKARPWSRRALWASISVLVAVALIVGLYTVLQPRRSPDPSGRPSVAVYWFENISDSEGQDYFVAGMTEELINELWKMGGLKVNTWDDIRPLRDETLTARQVGERLGYDYVLTGTIRRAADQIRVTPRLVDVSEGSQVWTARFDDVVDNVFALQDSIALEIASQLRVQLTSDERQEVAAQPTGSQEAYDHYLKGRYFHDRATFEDNERAVKEYEKALQTDKAYALAMAGLADAYVQRYKERYDYDEHWLDEAKRLIDASLDLDPDLGEAYESRAELLIEEENLLGALEAAERARDLRPDWDEPYVRLGEIRYERGERSKALEMFEQALGLRPSVDALCGRGRILRGRGDFEGAERDYRAALEIQADHVRPYLELGALYKWDLGRSDQAESFYRRAIEIRPDHRGGYNGVAQVLGRDSENYGELEALARNFVERFPYHWDAYEFLFEFLAWWKGEYEPALVVLDEALRRNPDRVWPHLLRASAYVWGLDKNPEPDKTREALERALAMRPNSRRVLEWAGDTYLSLGDQERALEYHRRALAVSPGSGELLADIAWSYSIRADFEKTAEYALQAVEQAPGDNQWPYLLLWNALEQLGRSEEMLPMLERAAREFGRDDPDFLALLGDYQRCAGRYDEALETYKRALAMKDKTWVLFGLAQTQFLVGDEEGSLETLERTKTNVHKPIVRILTWRGEFDKVEAYLQRIRDGMPDKYSGTDAWARRASQHYARMRRFDDAMAVLTEARDSGQLTWTEEYRLHEASWYLEKGEMKRARELLEEILSSTPHRYQPHVWDMQALLEARQGNLEQALDLYMRLYEGEVGRGESDNAAEAVAVFHYAMGHREEAREWVERIKGPRTANVMTGRFWDYVGLYRRAQLAAREGWFDVEHELERALRYLTMGVRSSFDFPNGMVMAYRSLTLARMGRSKEAIEEMERALRAEPESSETAYLAAGLYSLVGDKEKALHWLRTADDRGYSDYWWTRVDPDLDPLRDDPRFQQILDDGEARVRALFD